MSGKSHLSDISREDRDLIVSLPYRVGVWMSHAEDEGGEVDDRREMKTLERILTDIAKAEKVPVFVRELLDETISRRDRWPGWKESSFDVLPDCVRAVKILTANAGKADGNNFRRALKKIAASVAGAHGEFGFEEPRASLLRRLCGGLCSRKERAADFMNISAAEQDAMRRLVAALGRDDDK